MRESLFISHAAPQDNEFTAWLNSRLQRLGFKTWCDLRGLKGGESDFWLTIENEIRHNSIKYLLVLSKNTFFKDGVLDEFEFARSIAKEYKLVDFIIPLRIEDVPYNARIGLNRYNQIGFSNWSEGLIQLVEKLDSDSIPQPNHIEFADLVQNYNTLLKINSFGIQNRTELHYSTFWEINNIPKYLYVFSFYNETQAKHIEVINKVMPLIRHGNNIISFEQQLDFSLPDSKEEIKTTSVTSVEIQNILLGTYFCNKYPTSQDCEYLLKRLFNRCLHLFLKESGLYWYELSNKSNCYYFPKGLLKNNKTTFAYHNRKKTKNVLGKYFSSFWHFALSFKTRLHPFVCYSLKTHIIFSNDGRNIWENKDKLHKARRKKGKNMFNEEWRDQLFSFLSGLKDSDNEIIIPFSSVENTSMSTLTKQYESTVGYTEPKSKARIDLINTYNDEEEYYNSESDE